MYSQNNLIGNSALEKIFLTVLSFELQFLMVYHGTDRSIIQRKGDDRFD